jgi:hypothetical protein
MRLVFVWSSSEPVGAAFPGGAGTADMVRKARVAGVRVMEVEAA